MRPGPSSCHSRLRWRGVLPEAAEVALEVVVAVAAVKGKMCGCSTWSRVVKRWLLMAVCMLEGQR